MDFPLRQNWSVDLLGDIILNLEFEVQGKITNLAVKMPKTQSYAKFGGDKF